MAREHPSVLSRPLPGGIEDDGRAVPRRDVPGREREAVLRLQRDLAVRPPELRRRDVGARPVGRDDRDANRDEQPVCAEERRERDPGSTQMAAATLPARAPELPAREAEQDDPDREQEEPGPVLVASADGAGIRDREESTHQGQETDRCREGCAPARGQPRVEDDRRREDRHGCREPKQMLARAGPGLGCEPRVDRGMSREQESRGAEHEPEWLPPGLERRTRRRPRLGARAHAGNLGSLRRRHRTVPQDDDLSPRA